MLKKIKIDTSELKRFLKKLPNILVERALLFVFAAFLFDVLFGAFVFYRYTFLPQKRKIILPEEPLTIQEENLSEVLEETKKREQRFQNADFKTYPDLFRSQQASVPEQPPETEELEGLTE